MKTFREKAESELNKRVAKTLKIHPKKTVIRALEYQAHQYQFIQVYSAKGGILNTPDYDHLQICIEVIAEKIKELKT